MADAVRGAMTGEDPAEEVQASTTEATPAGEGTETPEPLEGEGEGAGEVAAEEGDDLAELDMSDLPAARKEYLKRDPEARAAWFFRQQMDRLQMTVPEAREFRKVFASPADAQFAMKRAADYRTLERALASDSQEAPLQALEIMRDRFGAGAERLVRVVAQHIDAVDPQAALARDVASLHKMFEELAPEGDFEKEALAAVWEMVERNSQKPRAARAPEDPEKRELEALRAEKRTQAQASVKARYQEARDTGYGAIRDAMKAPLAEAADRYKVPPAVLKDISEAVFGEVKGILGENPIFVDQFNDIVGDRARSPEQRKADVAKLVNRWGLGTTVDKLAQRLKPYTRGVLHANKQRLGHAREVGSLADLGGGTTTSGTAAKIPQGASLLDAARAAMR